MKKSSRVFLVLLLLSAVLATACGGAKKNETPTPAADNKQPAAAAGDGSLDRVKKAGKITIGMDTTYPPMDFIENGKAVGFDVDLFDAMAKKLGLTTEYKTVDFTGIITGLTAKRYDVVISSLNVTEERAKQVNFVQYASMSQVFVSRKGVNVKTEADLSGKVVIVQSDTTSQDWVDSTRKDKIKDIKDVKTFGAATDTFLNLQNGRGDVVVTDEPVGLYYAKKDPANFTVTGQAMKPEPIGIAIRKEDNDLQKALDQALKDLKADGTYKKISEQWFGKELGQ